MLSFSIALASKSSYITTPFEIVYYLPIDVGNEAKNAVAVFELHLTAYNEEVDHE